MSEQNYIIQANFVLIESDWNLKDETACSIVVFAAGINRIRLEFKGGYHSWTIYKNGVLIESDWNLKETEAADDGTINFVLIESDWNLKFSYTRYGEAISKTY